jgi:hypothetical protein
VLRLYRAINSVSLLLLILLAASCDKSTNPKPPDVLIPLAIGNQWEYAITDYDTNSVVISVDTVLLEIVKDTVIQNMTFYIITADGIRDPEIFWPSNQSDGVWLFILADSTMALAFEYPASVGDRITFGQDSMVVAHSNASVAVPAATFQCYQYNQYSSNLLEQIWYFSPNVGLVKTEDWARTQGGRLYLDEKIELISFNLH